MTKKKPTKQNGTTTIRLSQSERTLLKECAEIRGQKVSSFLKSTVIQSLGLPTKEDAVRLGFAEHLAQLRGLGTNINQLAKLAHMGQLNWDDGDRQQVARINDQLHGLAEILSLFIETARHRKVVPIDEFEASFEELMQAYLSLERGA